MGINGNINTKDTSGEIMKVIWLSGYESMRERTSCLTKGISGSMGEVGLVEVLMTGRVSAMDKGEEMEVKDMAIVMEGIEEVVTKSGESEQGIV